MNTSIRYFFRKYGIPVGIGLSAGFGGGLASLGGGTLLIPELTTFLGLSGLQARGTALAVALINALSGTLIYAADDRVAWSPVLWTGLPALIIAPIAARISQGWSTRLLRILFGVIVIFGGASLMAIGATPPNGIAHNWQIIYFLLVGVISGAVAGFAGISGGPVLAPLFVLGIGMPQALAQGSSMATRLPATLSGLWENARENHVCWRLLPCLVIGGISGSLLGARLALNLPEHILRLLFASLLIVLGIFEIINRPGHQHLHPYHHDPYP